MVIILSIESSTSVCSAALHQDGILVATQESKIPFTAAFSLAPLIQDLFESSRLSLKDIRAVAVSSGPGSYTGLRIAVATAKGISYGLQVPLLSIDTLTVLAESVEAPQTDLICPMIDARRMEVYCSLFGRTKTRVSPIEAKVVDADSFKKELSQNTILFLGNGASKCREVIASDRAIFLDGAHPLASAMGKIAYQKFQQKSWENGETFEPTYLKEFVAKTKSASSLL